MKTQNILFTLHILLCLLFAVPAYAGVFGEDETLEQFVTSGWQFGAQADAALKSGEKSAELGDQLDAGRCDSIRVMLYLKY